MAEVSRFLLSFFIFKRFLILNLLLVVVLKIILFLPYFLVVYGALLHQFLRKERCKSFLLFSLSRKELRLAMAARLFRLRNR